MNDEWEERLVNLTDFGLYMTMYSKFRQFYRPQEEERLGNGGGQDTRGYLVNTSWLGWSSQSPQMMECCWHWELESSDTVWEQIHLPCTRYLFKYQGHSSG